LIILQFSNDLPEAGARSGIADANLHHRLVGQGARIVGLLVAQSEAIVPNFSSNAELNTNKTPSRSLADAASGVHGETKIPSPTLFAFGISRPGLVGRKNVHDDRISGLILLLGLVKSGRCTVGILKTRTSNISVIISRSILPGLMGSPAGSRPLGTIAHSNFD
jgi:hypothetical protein